MEIKNKVALVTGGAVRVGRAISMGLAQEGAKVTVQYNRSQSAAKELHSQIEQAGGEAQIVQGDFRNLVDIEKVVNQCNQRFKQIDFLINNAAIYYKTPLGKVQEAQWDELMHLNLKAPFFCAQLVSKIMQKQGSGKIINITDVAGLNPWPDYLPYCTSKAGLIALTRGLAKELAPHIQVNAVASGTVLLQENATQEFEESIKNATLLKKIGRPNDIVNTVLFLLKGSDFITGEVVLVDGGRHLA